MQLLQHLCGNVHNFIFKNIDFSFPKALLVKSKYGLMEDVAWLEQIKDYMWDSISISWQIYFKLHDLKTIDFLINPSMRSVENWYRQSNLEKNIYISHVRVRNV